MLHSALEVRGVDGSLALAAADDYSPTAAEDVPSGIRIFFASATERDLAGEALRRASHKLPIATKIVKREEMAV